MRRAERDDLVFKALADATRRKVLDRLRANDGQTLTDLCAGLDMARQSVTQHIEVLVSAGLVSVVRHGRERLHYLNPVPINEIQHRWIQHFEQPRLDVLHSIKQRAETAMATTTERPSFLYVSYIEATPEAVWHTLTDAELTATYWGHSQVSDWKTGSSWHHRRTDGSGIDDVTGTIVESDPPHRLVMTWQEPHVTDPALASRVTFTIEPADGIVRLTVTHTGLADDEARRAVSHGWPAVLSNLKSLIETGHVLPQSPWTMARP